jgi:tetratricopeptide (TPR) repeat protein
MDFAADAKDAKKATRAMLVLVNDINERLAADAGGSGFRPVRVECVTCHRGLTNPQQLSDLLWDTMLGKGDSAAVALYRDLRQKYYGAQAYDFRESLLPLLARRSLTLNKLDDAVAWLQLNLEFYPQSATSYLALAEAHRRQQDRSAAVRDLQKALELDPSNTDAKRQLKAVSR